MIGKFRGIAAAVRNTMISRRLHSSREAAKRVLQANGPLWTTLADYLAKSTSTGGEYTDYLALYQHVRTHKPREILECGTGVSTVVLAHALMENEREFGIVGRIASMEDKKQWLDVAQELLPPHLTRYVDLVFSPRVEDGWYIYRGVRYDSVPDRPYDFVFVDGPDFDSLSDGQLTFDFDLIRVVEKADNPVYAIVDDRLSTSYVYQKVFGVSNVRYSTRHRLSFIGPITGKDLLGMERQKPCFIRNFRFFGATKLEIEMQPRTKAGVGA